MAALSSIFCFFVATGAGCEKVAASRFPAVMRNTQHNTWKQMITEQKKRRQKRSNYKLPSSECPRGSHETRIKHKLVLKKKNNTGIDPICHYSQFQLLQKRAPRQPRLESL